MSRNPMSPQPGDDLERRLHDVMHDRGLAIRPDGDALERIHAGARRRQRRRAALSGLASVAVVAVAATAVALGTGSHHTGVQTATQRTASTLLTPTSPAPQPPSESPSPTQSQLVSKPATTVNPSGAPATIPAGGTPPKGFVPISVTAISTKTYWVLGHAPCAQGSCVGIAKTTDGGQTFTEIGAPGSQLVPDAPGNVDVFGTDTISDIRFVNDSDGWAYGGALWQTTDGGQHWAQVSDPASPITGPVQQFAVASGRAWAVAFADKAGGAPLYQLYSATYPNGQWAPASSTVFGPAEPMFTIQNKTVTIIGTDSATGKQTGLRTTDGQTFTALPSGLPCTNAPGQPLSPTPQGLWLACTSATGKLGGVYFSSDFGASWQAASSSLADPRVAIGGIDDKSAIVATGGHLVKVNVDGSSSPASAPSTPATTTFAFIGFTNAQNGFAIPEVNGGRQLWRTTDGGDHWAAVKIGS